MRRTGIYCARIRYVCIVVTAVLRGKHGRYAYTLFSAPSYLFRVCNNDENSCAMSYGVHFLCLSRTCRMTHLISISHCGSCLYFFMLLLSISGLPTTHGGRQNAFNDRRLPHALDVSAWILPSSIFPRHPYLQRERKSESVSILRLSPTMAKISTKRRYYVQYFELIFISLTVVGAPVHSAGIFFPDTALLRTRILQVGFSSEWARVPRDLTGTIQRLPLHVYIHPYV